MNTPSEVLRLLHNLIRVGSVIEVDPAATPPVARVAVGDIETDWLPYGAARAGDDRSAWHLSKGEQVVILSPGGELAAGIIAFSLNSQSHPAPSGDGQVVRSSFGNGTEITLDKQANELTVQHPGLVRVEAGGDIVLTATGDVSLTGANIRLNENG